VSCFSLTSFALILQRDCVAAFVTTANSQSRAA
jgi:hypothetical protein